MFEMVYDMVVKVVDGNMVVDDMLRSELILERSVGRSVSVGKNDVTESSTVVLIGELL